MYDVLKGQIIDTIGDTYLCELRNKYYTGYLGVTTRDILDHLIGQYGKITAADLEANKSRMNEPIDITHTIALFFKRIDDCIQYANAGEVPLTPEQILQTAYHAVSTCGHYNDTCKIWRKKPAVAKTWALFKPYFAKGSYLQPKHGECSLYHELKVQERKCRHGFYCDCCDKGVSLSSPYFLCPISLLGCDCFGFWVRHKLQMGNRPWKQGRSICLEWYCDAR